VRSQILAVKLDLAARLEVTFQELLALDLHNLVGREPSRENLQDLLRVHSGLGAQNQASLTASMVRATTICLHAFTTRPAPEGPTW
jgi:hypothetical protein